MKEIKDLLDSFEFQFPKSFDGKDEKETRKLKRIKVIELTNSLFNHLKCKLKKLNIEKFNNLEWSIDQNISDSKDKADIIAKNEKVEIIIELDPHRADAIAKKFVSRIALSIPSNKELIYIIFLYPGTKNMSINESKKYIKYIEAITNNLKGDNVNVICYLLDSYPPDGARL